MTTSKYVLPVFFAAILLFISSCKTDPVIPIGGVSTEGPTVIDPGDESPCTNGEISFQHQVLPIMVSACAYSGCHDVVSAEDGIVLNNYENVIKEVTPNDPNNSELYESIIETDPDDIMPPPPASPLTSNQINIIKDWINQGAKNTDCGTPYDSTASSFSVDIFPLITDYCVGCHNSNRSDGNVDIDSHAKVIPYITNGSFMATVRHEALYPKMPPSGSQLSTCRISQIQKWIDEGALDN